MAVKHDELRKRCSGEAEMPIHDTTQFYSDTYGLNEVRDDLYPSQKAESNKSTKSGIQEVESSNENDLPSRKRDDTNDIVVKEEYQRVRYAKGKIPGKGATKLEK